MRKTAILLTALYFCLIPGAYAFDSDQIQIHGFISQGYLKSAEHDFWYTETKDGTFQFNEMGINFIAMPMDDLRLGIQFLARDFGEIGNNEVEVDWAYGDYRFRNWLGIRAGLLKRPHGLYNQSRDIDAARTGIFLPLGVYPEVSREFFLSTKGIGIYGILPGNLSYEFQYGTISVDNDDGIVKQANTMLGSTTESIETDYVVAGMLRWDTPLSGLALAVTAFRLGDNVMNTNIGKVCVSRYDEYVYSLEYVYEDLTISAEYRNNPVEIVLNDTMKLVDGEVTEGYHITGAYRFTDWFELGMGYSELYGDKGDRGGDRYKKMGQPEAKAWRKVLSLSTRFDINDYWIFKLEGNYMNGLEGVTSDLGDDPSEDWFILGAKMTFSF
jgi:hypothetical protein